MSRNVTLWRGALLVAVAVALLAVSGASALSTASASSTASAVARPQATVPKPATKQQWAALVTKAKREGSVVVYTTQNPTTFANMAAKFKEKYGINVTINRNIDAVLAAQVTAEFGSGKRTADIWIPASKPLVLGAIKNGWLVDAVGPNLFAKTYDRSTLAKPGKAFIVGTAVLGMGWNTNFFPTGLNDLPDLLNSRLKGRVGIPQPTSASFVDYYLWVQQTYGTNFLPRLAEQQPKIYTSSLPMTQAVASGEIAASPFVVATLLDLKNQGAPVGFKLAKGFKTWNAPFWGMILKDAPHAAAAQLLADYMVTKEGMGLATRLSGSVIEGIPNSFYTTPRSQKLSDLTPKKIADFQAYWNSLFRR